MSLPHSHHGKEPHSLKRQEISKIGMYLASMLNVPQEVIKSPNKTFYFLWKKQERHEMKKAVLIFQISL